MQNNQPYKYVSIIALFVALVSILRGGEVLMEPTTLSWNNWLAMICILIALGFAFWQLFENNRRMKRQANPPDSPRLNRNMSANINLDFSTMNPEQIDTVMKYLKGSIQAELLIGGEYATKETTEAETEEEESGKAQGN